MNNHHVNSGKHFHIHWNGKHKLDWECFATREDAEASARELVQPGETYVIELVSDKCPLRTESASPPGRRGIEA